MSRILIAEDEARISSFVEKGLVAAGFATTVVENGLDAVELVLAGSCDLLVLDIGLPGIDGYELCRQIKQSAYTRRTPTLMLTSRSSPFDRARGALAGCDAYLVKPISAQIFFGTIDKILVRYFQNNRTLLAARGYRAAASS